MIEQAYRTGESNGLAVWVEDEAGPYQAVPQAGQSWCAQGHPGTQPHEYVRGDTAKLLTFFHPQTGELRAKGVTSSANAVLHPWLKGELEKALAGLPAPLQIEKTLNRAGWDAWRPSERCHGIFAVTSGAPSAVSGNLFGIRSPRWAGMKPLVAPIRFKTGSRFLH